MKKILVIIFCLAKIVPALAQNNQLMVNSGHAYNIEAMDLSKDGKWLVTTADDRTIRIWHYPHKKLYRILHSFTKRDIIALTISPDGKYIAAGGQDNAVRIWERKTGRLMHKLKRHTAYIKTLAFSPDSKMLASGANDQKIILWEVESGENKKELKEHADRLTKLVYSPNSKWLVSADEQGNVFIWQLSQHKVIRKIKAYKQEVVNMAMSNDGRKIITLTNTWGSYAGFDVWDFGTGQKITGQQIKGNITNAFDLNPKNNEVVTANDKGLITRWDISGVKITKVKSFELRHGASTLQYTADQGYLIAGLGGGNYPMKVINIDSGKETFSVAGYGKGVQQVAIRDHQMLITKDQEPALVWNGTGFARLKKSSGSQAFFRPDRKTTLGALYAGGYAVWDNATGNIIKKEKDSFFSTKKTISLSPKGTYYASSTSESEIRIFKTANPSEKPFRTIKPKAGGRFFAFSPNEKLLALSGETKRAEIWDVTQNKLLHTLKGHYWRTTRVAFSPDGARLVSGGAHGNIAVWNAKNGKLLKNIPGYKDDVTHLVFSKNNRYILSGSNTGEIRIWNAKNYKFLKKFFGHKNPVTWVTFTDDNKKIISADAGGETIVWDTETGLRLLNLQTFNKGKDYVVFTPNNKFDGTAAGIKRLYRVRNDSILPAGAANRVKDLLNKVLKSKTSDNVSSSTTFSYYNILLTSPGEPSAKISKETAIKHDKESLIIKGKLQNIKVGQITHLKIDGRRATFSRNDLTFSSRRISFVESPTKDVLVEVYTKDGNVISRLLRISATLRNVTQKPTLVVTKGHKKTIVAVDFHPKGKYFATASEDQSIKIWDRSIKQEFRTLNGHKQQIIKMKFSPNGKYIASLDRNEVILWRHPSGRIIKRIKTYGGSILFTSDSKRLIVQEVTPSSGFTGNMTVYNTRTGEQIKEYVDLDLGDNASLAPNNRWLFSKGKRIDLDTGEDKGYFENKGTKMYVWTMSDVSKTHFAAYNIQTQQIQIWSLADHTKTVANIAFPMAKGIKKIQFTHNGKHLIVGTYYYQLMVYKVPGGKFFKEIKLKKGTIADDVRNNRRKKLGIGSDRELGILRDFSISNDDKFLAVNAYVISYNEKSKNPIPQNMIGVRFIRLKNHKEVSLFGGFDEGLNNFSVVPNEKYMVSSHYGRSPGIRLWNLRKGQIDGFVPLGYGQSHSNGKHVAVYDVFKKSIKIYSLPNLKEVFSMNNMEQVMYVYISQSSRTLVYKTAKALGGNKFEQLLNIWDISSLKAPKLVRKISTKNLVTTSVRFQAEAFKISPDDKYLIRKMHRTNTFKIESIELATGKMVMNFEIDNYQDHILDFVPNKPHVLVSKIFQDEGEFKTRLVELNYTNGKKIASLETDYEIIFDAHFSPDGQYLVTGSGGYWMPQNIHFDVAIWDWSTKNLNCVLTGHAINVRHVWFGKKGKKVYSADDNSIIKVWNIDKCKLAGSFLGLNDDDYIILNADSYYKTSKGSINGIGFRYKGQLRAFGQFDLRFNRPDLVMKDLGASKLVQRIYYKAWKKRLRRAGITEEMIAGEMHLPEVQIADKFSLPPSTTSPKIGIKVRAHDHNNPLKHIQVYINDVPLYGKAGLPARGKNTFEQTIEVKLNQGKNKVAVAALNENGLESAKETFNIEYKAPRRKPNLYMLAIGVSKYQDAERNLKYAEKDANNLSDTLYKSSSYGKKIIKRVLNENATKENILKVAEMFKQTKVDDQVIIYISCHGLLDEKMDYYLATTDVDFNNPAKKGLPYEAIEQMLDKIPARRRLIMIDACHSGELDKSEMEVANTPVAKSDKGEAVTVAFKGGSTFVKPKAGLNNSFDYMKALFNDISNHSGATIISAAAGYEFALESKEWNNGVFTYSVMQALGADSKNADFDNDGQISISELKDYVINRVSELTNGKQVPTTRRENQSVDVVIYKKPEPKKK